MEEFNSEEYLEQRSKQGKTTYDFSKVKTSFILLVIIAFAGVAWYGYNNASKIEDSDLPLIQAKQIDIKSEPKDPGGLVVAHRDKSIYESMSNKKFKKTKTEKPVAQPEDPVTKEVVTKKIEKEIEKPADETNSDFIVSKNPKEAKQEENTAKEVAAQPIPAKPAETMPPEDDLDELDKELSKIDTKTAENESITIDQPKNSETSTEQTQSDNSKTTYAIRIAALKTEESAIDAWKSLKSDYSSILGDLSSEIIKTEKDGKVIYYLQAGPISNKEQADAACAKLQNLGRRCRVY